MSTRLALALLVAGLATAEASPATPFLTLDRPGERSAIGVGLSTFTYGDDHMLADAWRIDLYGRFKRGPFTAYGQMSWSHIDWRDPRVRVAGQWVTLTNWTSASNIEAGVMYALRGRHHELHLRGGLFVPTASEGYYGANFGTMYVRLTDLAAVAPGAWWLRPGLTLRGWSPGERFFYQVDASLCLPVESGEENPFRAITTVNAGVGARFEPVQVTLELVNVVESGTVLHSLATTVAFGGERLVPYLGVTMPFMLGESPPAWAFSAGVHIRP